MQSTEFANETLKQKHKKDNFVASADDDIE